MICLPKIAELEQEPSSTQLQGALPWANPETRILIFISLEMRSQKSLFKYLHFLKCCQDDREGKNSNSVGKGEESSSLYQGYRLCWTNTISKLHGPLLVEPKYSWGHSACMGRGFAVITCKPQASTARTDVLCHVLGVPSVLLHKLLNLLGTPVPSSFTWLTLAHPFKTQLSFAWPGPFWPLKAGLHSPPLCTHNIQWPCTQNARGWLVCLRLCLSPKHQFPEVRAVQTSALLIPQHRAGT